LFSIPVETAEIELAFQKQLISSARMYHIAIPTTHLELDGEPALIPGSGSQAEPNPIVSNQRTRRL
jgi:hypothetical protein